jgi:cyclase
MTVRWRGQKPLVYAGMALMLAGLPAFAQVDLSGVWSAVYHEDQQERIPGPELGDYLGLPINEAARFSALAWSASRLTLPEEQCRVHALPYIYRGPMTFRSWEEKDPETQRLIAIRQYLGNYEQSRTIWMDGRPHPPEFAAHTWMGFSTGKWEGDGLTVTSTHIKQDWTRRNGIPQSDLATLVEHFIRHGDVLTHVTIVTDPVYLAEPLIKSQDFVLQPSYQGSWLYPCDPVQEIAGRKKGAVPMFQPGENVQAKEFQTRHGISEAAAMGGPETAYPEFRQHPTPSAKLAPTTRVVAMKPDSEVHVWPVQGSVYLLTADGTNIAAQVGKQGILLVDTLTAAVSDKVLAALATLTNGKIRYIVNTSADAEHTGGNDALRKAGVTILDLNAPGSFTPLDAASGAQIIAHDNVLKRMSAPTGTKPPFPPGAWPTTTFLEDEHSQYFNQEPIKLYFQPSASSDGDVIALFRRSDVIVTGDVFSTDRYPMIHVDKGGSIDGLLDALNRIVEMAVPAHEEEGGTMIIPGHGRICDRSDVVPYRDMVAIVRERVRAMKARGMTLEQVKAARPTLDYDPEYGSLVGPWTTSDFVRAVYQSLK